MALTLSATSIIGDDVRNDAGEALGSIKDIMLDTSTGRIEYAVLQFGGVMFVGDKLFAVPWDQFTVDTAKKELVLNVPKERLKDAPGFDKDNWPNFADQAYRTELSGYYGAAH
ncbi:PRC-barrel domain-containing protein [Parvularcula dongshanensis]|uniref:Sporulation protein YlmC with PRC-barrel domain n=1 Tax=Parvularcula dongshanensis TaxID=1173995 RepID=A0A840I1F4_9PROT|nr:PRC-barrel domain-containing protein [Parvularcula dongshanensis]MBB4658577.1 sporulation protein YlmC with PRC-barrel domain [Parvularcula dongshanensis]